MNAQQTTEAPAEKESFERAQAHLWRLEDESAGLAVGIEQAATDGDSGRFTALLMRERALPGELERARREAMEAELAYVEAALYELEQERPRMQQAATDARYRLTQAKREAQRVGTYSRKRGVSEKEREKALAAYEEAAEEEERQREAGEDTDRRARSLTERRRELREKLEKGDASE